MTHRLRRTARLTAAAALVALMSACSGFDEPAPPPPRVDLIATSYDAAERLVELSAAPISADLPLLVTTVVDNADLGRSAGLGRLVAEQVASRLANLGYTVREVRMAQALMLAEGSGELILSRNAREVGRQAGAQAVVAGTYTVADEAVFVNLKLLRAADGRVLSAVDWTMPKTADVAALVQGRRDVPLIMYGR